MVMSIAKLAEIYENSILIEMDVGGIMGGEPTSGGNLENTDEYAPNDNRIPYVMGRIQSRTGKVGTQKKAKKTARVRRRVGL